MVHIFLLCSGQQEQQPLFCLFAAYSLLADSICIFLFLLIDIFHNALAHQLARKALLHGKTFVCMCDLPPRFNDSFFFFVLKKYFTVKSTIYKNYNNIYKMMLISYSNKILCNKILRYTTIMYVLSFHFV